MSNTLTSPPAGHWPARRSIISAQLQTQFGMDQGLSIDVENATLDDVNKHTEVMNANIAELIIGGMP